MQRKDSDPNAIQAEWATSAHSLANEHRECLLGAECVQIIDPREPEQVEEPVKDADVQIPTLRTILSHHSRQLTPAKPTAAQLAALSPTRTITAVPPRPGLAIAPPPALSLPYKTSSQPPTSPMRKSSTRSMSTCSSSSECLSPVTPTSSTFFASPTSKTIKRVDPLLAPTPAFPFTTGHVSAPARPRAPSPTSALRRPISPRPVDYPSPTPSPGPASAAKLSRRTSRVTFGPPDLANISESEHKPDSRLAWGIRRTSNPEILVRRLSSMSTMSTMSGMSVESDGGRILGPMDGVGVRS